MARLPRVSGEQAVRVFEKLGFTRVRQRGSHVIMRRQDRGCVIPLHRELATGTLRSALRQAQVDPDTFMEALEGR